MFMFFYRPLFFDVKNPLMLINSFENLIYLVLTGIAMHRFSLRFLLIKKSYYYTIHFYFFFLFWIVFSFFTNNLGLAVRMKVMMMPSFLSLVILSLSYKKSKELKLRNQDDK